MMQIGLAKRDITVFKMHCGMLGYGRHFHYLESIETPQFARAMVLKQDAGPHLALLNVEFCFCTEYLRQGLLLKLQTLHPDWAYSTHNLMITAQHTHSTAGGYDQHLIYSLYTPGFQSDIYEAYLEGLYQTLLAAHADLAPGILSWGEGSFDPETPVCFNRSLGAYNANPEVKLRGRLQAKNRHLAADRTMKMLRIQAPNGQLRGSWNWFGVHTTSVSNRYRKVCFDNKGYAAQKLENTLSGTHVFAQDACGDISPNSHWSRKYGEYRGPFADDYENADFNGQLQAEKAKDILEDTNFQTLSNNLDSLCAYFDFSKTQVNPSFANGHLDAKTSDAAFGISFLEGTSDGRGAPKALGLSYRLFQGLIRRGELLLAGGNREKLQEFHQAQAPKAVVMNLSQGRVLGTGRIDKLIIPDFADPGIKYLKLAAKMGHTQGGPWVPTHLPLQLFCIGELALVGIPAEITTWAGIRLRKSLEPWLEKRGIRYIQLCPYANSYAGYITTREEYKTQHYEGGHTLFGQWTLAAYQTHFQHLAQAFLEAPDQRGQIPETTQAQIFNTAAVWQGLPDPKLRVL